MSDNKVILYNGYMSSSSWRVRIALALKGVKYEYNTFGLGGSGDEDKLQEYKKLNPMAQIPCMSVGGHILTQSLPIIEYLEEVYPQPPLLPKDPIGRAKVRALSEVINSGIQPLQSAGFLRKVGEGTQELAQFYIEKGFNALEEMLKQTSGIYSYGDHVTMSDLFLVPQVYNATSRYKVNMDQFPIIQRINANLVSLPAFIVAHPERQPDTPDDIREK